MKLARLALGAATAAAVWSSAAVASATIIYKVSGTASGDYGPEGGGTMPFSNEPVMVDIVGNPAGAFDDTTDEANLVPIIAASLTALGHTYSIYVGSDTYFGTPDASNIGNDMVAVVTGTPGSLTADLVLEGSGLLGYDGVSNLSATPVVFDDEPGFTVDDHGNPVDVQFTSVTDASFAAVVPEPGAWTLSIMGAAWAGAALRRRRSPAFGRELG
jgi:hypothetical protein